MPDSRQGVVLHLAQPGEPKAGKSRYSLEELDEGLAALKELFTDLQRLCAVERRISPASAAAFLTTQPIAVVEQA